MKKLPLLCLLSTLCTPLLHAGDVTGVFDFPARTPFVALVYFSDDTEGGPELCGSLNQKNKAFSDRLVASKTGCEVTFHNSDEMQHNVFASDVKSGISFDVGLLSPGQTGTASINWDVGKVVRVGCKIHPKMRSYVANVPSKHYAIVSFEDASSPATFTIPNVPDNIKQVSVWFPGMESLDLELPNGSDQTVDITRHGKVYGTLNLKR